MYRGLIAFTGIAMALLIIIGCSGGGGSPVAPETDLSTAAAFNPGSQVLLGLYDIAINPDTMEVEIIPVREAQFQINVIKFLQPPAGNPANLGITINPGGTNLAAGIIDLDVSITHPFPGSNLRGFDVRGIVLGEKGTQLSLFDWDVQYPKPTELRLVNADGYTRWWNAVEFLTPGLFGYTKPIAGGGNPKATINGFKYHSDSLDAGSPMSDLDPATRGTLSTEDGMGGPNTATRQYIIQFAMNGGVPSFKFRYAICASFLPPIPGAPSPAPVSYYPINANTPEPYWVDITMDPASTAYYTLSQAGGDLVLNIDIHDWQASQNPGGMDAELGKIRLESPTLWSGMIDPTITGTWIESTDPTLTTWQVEIKNVTPTDTHQDVLITVQSANTTSYAPPVPTSIYPGGAILSAYNMVTFELPGNSMPQIGEIVGPGKYGPNAQLAYQLTWFDDLQDGQNCSVTWDFDSNGVFDDDQDGSDTNLIGTYTFPGPGNYQVQCKVTDTQGGFTLSNILTVTPISMPYLDDMDIGTESLWTIQNAVFGYVHNPSPFLEWNVQTDHWSTSNPSDGQYENNMSTLLISPVIPAGVNDEVTVGIDHRYTSESSLSWDWCQPFYRINGGAWMQLSDKFNNISPNFPNYHHSDWPIGGLTPGDNIEVSFWWRSDGSNNSYTGWDITYFSIIDNQPPDILGIWGPQNVNTLGPVTYSTAATDLDGIASYMWSLEQEGNPPVYDDPGDGMGNFNAMFPADENYWIEVEVTDAGDPPLSDTFGPYAVTVFSFDPDAFYSEDFHTDPGTWVYHGGISDGAAQDFWHFDTPNQVLTNVGINGCFAETSTVPTEKTASIDITFPSSAFPTNFKIVHRVWADGGGISQPYDGQWLTIDGTVVSPTYGFPYTTSGSWTHGYFVGTSGGNVISTFELGTAYNNGGAHTLTFHQLSTDTINNCLPYVEGWQVDYIEFWLVD